MNTPPILYVFRGWQSYLEISVQQARLYNPQSRILHVTSRNSRVASGAEHVTDEEYRGLADRFALSYQHMSVNPRDFELFCFQRWMVALEVMNSLNLDQAVLMDGDVLLWSPVDQVFEDFSKYGLSWTEPDQPGTVFVARRDALQKLCDIMLWHYETEEGMNVLRAELRHRIACGLPAAITDMSLLRYYREQHPNDVGDNGQIVQGGRFDHNMMESDGFEMECGLKRFVWMPDGPYARRSESGALVRFHSMHFVGRSKGYMSLYARRRNLNQLTKLYSAPQWIRARVPSIIRRIKHIILHASSMHA